MRSKFKWIFTLLLALTVQFSFAQEKTITGVVSDANGPLPGVNVLVKGTQRGVSTGFDGSYSIKAKEGETLVYSFMGMRDVSKIIGASNVINTILQDDAKQIGEVVIVAYGKQSKKEIVGSVVKVNKEVLEKQQATSVLSAIQGSVPGVNIIAPTGQPGENPTIRIRGISTINGSAEPLVIVDGAPYNGNFNTISADQIESISVLKDASSTSLYGSRGSNGVIVINTKRGKLKSPSVLKYNTITGVGSNAVPLHSMINTDTYFKLNWEALRNSNQFVNGQNASTAASNASNDLITTLGYNPYNINNPVDVNGQLVTTAKKWDTNWADVILNDAAIRTEHSLSVSGGSDNTSYFVSGNYLNQEGNVATSNFKRFTSRINVDSKINDWLNVGLNTFYSTSSQNYPTQAGNSFSSAIQWIYTVPSLYPLYRRDENGDLVYNSKGEKIFDYGATAGQLVNGNRPTLNNENAYGALKYYVNKNRRDNFSANGYASFLIYDGLTFKTNLTYEKYIFDNFLYAHDEYGYASNVNGRVTQSRDFTTSTNFVNSLNYKKTFAKKHNLGLDLIQEAYQFKLDTFGASAEGFLPGVQNLDGSTKPVSASGAITEERLASYLSRLSYNFDGKYFVEGSLRKDGSSRFSKDTRWGTFYSVGGAWLVSNESFLKDSKVISELKLKASYGELGNNRLSSYFPYIQQFTTGYNELDNTGVLLADVVDPNLRWEKTASSNYGLEFSLLNGRINGGVDYYVKESVDLVNNKPIPGSTGDTEIVTNIGSVKNYGWEFSLGTKNVAKKDFVWNTDLNFSFDKNKITSLSENGNTIVGTKRYEVGKSLYDFYIQEWAGVDPNDGYGMWYKDEVVNGVKTGNKITTKLYTEATRYYTGKKSLPDVIGGLTNYFRYKNIDLNILTNFSFGAYVYDSTYAGLMGGFRDPGYAVHSDIQNRWQQPGDVTNVPVLLSTNNNFNSQSTRFLFKNDYIRLKALNLGYNFDKGTAEKMNLKSLRLYLQADNLFTYQSHKGIDPEQNVGGTTDSRSYNMRYISFGANIEL